MPKRKLPVSDEPVITRPQRNTRAKKVFDPSDNHIPKRRIKSAKPVNKKKNLDVKPKNTTSNELFSYPSNDIIDAAPIPGMRAEVFQEKKSVCFMCSKTKHKKELMDCPICNIKAHRECLIADEPMWKFRFNLFPWFCKPCRNEYCCKCLKNESQGELVRRCITCNVGLHLKCYESFDIKPLHTIQSEMYLCIPCMTLATHRVPEEGVVEEEDDDEPLDSRTSSISLLTSDEDDDDDDDDDDNISNSSMMSNNSEKRYYFENKTEEVIPDVTTWDKYQIHDYLKNRLPEEIAQQLLLKEFDGRAVLLFRRPHIESLNMKLGYALKVYKEVRILQTRKSYYSVYWE